MTAEDARARGADRREELDQAERDACLFGAGFLVVRPDGAERIDPARVVVKPDKAMTDARGVDTSREAVERVATLAISEYWTWNQGSKRREEAAALLRALLAERDKSATDVIWMQQEVWDAQAERDAARAEVERLRRELEEVRARIDAIWRQHCAPEPTDDAPVAECAKCGAPVGALGSCALEDCGAPFRNLQSPRD